MDEETPDEQAIELDRVNAVLIGDGFVGKTCMAMAYVHN